MSEPCQFIFGVKVRFQNVKVTFEFQGHGVTTTKRRPSAGMCYRRTRFNYDNLVMCGLTSGQSNLAMAASNTWWKWGPRLIH